MDDVTKRFLEKVEEIKAEKPAYKLGGDGSGGVCDCIGLVIGALKRMGLKWIGIHGSNWAARHEFVALMLIGGVTDLQVGDVVLKARDSRTSTWKLPKRYQMGGAYYNGDLRDYYHAGVVTSVNPLRITHMTTPSVKVDKTLGKWNYHGRLRILVKTGGTVVQEPAVSGIAVPAAGKTAVVAASSGRYVKMRQQPSTSCRMWEEIPIGAKVEIVMPGEVWARINYGRRKGWYMMAKYLQVQE